MAKKKNFDTVQKAFLSILKSAAKEAKVELHQVEPAQFWAVSEGKLTEWDVRKYGGFSKIKQKVAPYESSGAERSQMLNAFEKRKEKKLQSLQMMRDQRLSDLESFAKDVFEGKVAAHTPPKSKKPIKRILNAVISDTHFGADILKEETGALTYGRVEEARRLGAVVKQIIEYKPQYREETELELMILGDIIQGALHDPRDGAPVAEQQARSIHLLSQAIAQLAASFPKVRVRCQTGNHGRRKSRHMERATTQKWDSEETVIYYALKFACSNLKNVEFFLPLTPYGIYENFGAKIFYTHGDTVLNPGYPGSAIKNKSLEEQINKINAALPDKDEIKVVVVGHVHTGSCTNLGNGAVMITNGALDPVDQFATSIGLLESAAGQYIFESVEGHPVGDIRYIRVNLATDEDASLDKIIRPWSGFND